MSAARLNSDERGWVLVVAMVVMVLMLGIGLAALSLSDTQNSQSRKEREREATLNLAEGVLYSQSFILSLPPSCDTGPCEGWPGVDTRAYSGCNQGSGGLQCPDDATLANVAGGSAVPASFSNVDTKLGTTWTTTIEDNGPGAGNNDYATRFDTAVGPNTVWHYDKNGDNKVWVRAEAIVRKHRRVVVGLMQIESVPVSFPRTAITAGTFSLQQNGNNTYIDTGGTTVQLRCDPGPPASPSCDNYDKTGQITGAPGSIVGGTSSSSILPDDQRLGLMQKAKDIGGYFPAGTCPSADDMERKATIYVVNCNRTYDNSNGIQGVGGEWQCTYSIRGYTPVSNQRCIHGPGRTPFGGTVVWERGTLGFTNGVAFFGVIYHLNLNKCGAPTSDDVTDAPPGLCQYDATSGQSVVITTAGGGTIVGSVNVDGAGGVQAGNNKFNIVYDPAVFNDQTSFGTTGLVQNTWRELDPAQFN
jgi:hypothetical protein